MTFARVGKSKTIKDQEVAFSVSEVGIKVIEWESVSVSKALAV